MERKMKNYNELDILSLKTELNFREYSESTKKIYVQVVCGGKDEMIIL